MNDREKHIHIVDDLPAALAREDDAAGPVLVVALDGFLDAGAAGRAAVDHVLGENPGPVVATFDLDPFYDYRARRPAMLFVEDHYADYEAPRLVVRLAQDRNGAPYLVMHGPEPDFGWEMFARAVRAVVDQLGVRLVVPLGAVPMAVPHTRPVMVTNHATRSDLLLAPNVWRGEIRIPASALSLLELRLGEWGYDAVGFVAHVPHYVAQSDYPAAAVALLEQVEIATGLEWDLEPLQRAATEREAEIAQQINDSPEVAEVVSGLEQQYDAFRRGDSDDSLPLAEERDLPTAEELGAEFERFLAGLDPDD